MARPFKTVDAKRLLSKYNHILEELNNAANAFKNGRDDIKKASDALVVQDLLNVLREIPIDEINRGKRGH